MAAEGGMVKLSAPLFFVVKLWVYRVFSGGVIVVTGAPCVQREPLGLRSGARTLLFSRIVVGRSQMAHDLV